MIHDIDQHCEQNSAKYLAYWYFQFGDDTTKSIYTMTRSLIRQLCRSPLHPSVAKIWEDHHLPGSQPGSESISQVLEELLDSISGKAYIVLDALDECPVDALNERGLLLSFLIKLLARHDKKVNILATSRSEPDIKAELEKFPTVNVENRLAGDVKKFVTASITEGRLKKQNDETKKMIVEKLLSSKERYVFRLQIQRTNSDLRTF